MRDIDVSLVAFHSKDQQFRRLYGWKIKHCVHSSTIGFGAKLETNNTRECFKINIIPLQSFRQQSNDCEDFIFKFQKYKNEKHEKTSKNAVAEYYVA